MNFLFPFIRHKALQIAKFNNRKAITNLYSTSCLTNNENLIHKTVYTHKYLIQQRFMSSKEEDKPSFIKRMLRGIGLYSVSEGKLRLAGYNLYENVVDKLDYSYWMKENGLEDNFMSWFLITELHLWMLLIRCMSESAEGRIVRNSAIEALWSDVGIRSTKYHPSDRSVVRKQVQLLSQEFQAALVNYDEGLMTNDMALAGAVWRRFFLMQSDNPVYIENVVRYIRKQIHELDNIPKTEFFNVKANIKWIPLNEKK